MEERLEPWLWSSHQGSVEVSLTGIHKDVGSTLVSLSGLGIWHCHELWCRLAAAGLIRPSLGTSICYRHHPRKTKTKKERKEGRKEGRKEASKQASKHMYQKLQALISDQFGGFFTCSFFSYVFNHLMHLKLYLLRQSFWTP